MSELYLVRHAQANFGVENYDTLSSLGQQQSEWLGEYFLERDITFYYTACGDMQRHKQTLDAISEKLKLNSNQQNVLRGFNEYNFKEMIQAFGAQHPEDKFYQAAMKQPGNKKTFFRLLRQVLIAWSKDQIDGVAESWEMFQQRVRAEMSAIQASVNSGERVLVISSGGAISMFIGLVLDLSAEKIIELNLQTKNTGISHFFFNKQVMTMSGFNAIPHLEHPDRVNHITYG